MAKPYVIGIDMGGTNTVFGIVDARGTVIASSSIKTAKHSDVNDYVDESVLSGLLFLFLFLSHTPLVCLQIYVFLPTAH